VGDIRHCFADITKARELLGYAPKVRLQDGMVELLDWVQQQAAEDHVPKMEKELAARNLVRDLLHKRKRPSLEGRSCLRVI